MNRKRKLFYIHTPRYTNINVSKQFYVRFVSCTRKYNERGTEKYNNSRFLYCRNLQCVTQNVCFLIRISYY